ncbi:hypothetical protein [Neisseria animalis]|uniref:hypothetical protein n=1 Tax=Neisseria animalis TaxID=492 RepID=UPI0013BE998B|nr:hypothetical protein [Neisseria animalis]
MDFNVKVKGGKVIEALDKAKSVRRLLWGCVWAVPLTVLVWKAADILNVLAALK